jgi:hypothetical protein
MEKEFVSYELALELKQLEFDEECFAYWGISRILQTEGEIMLEDRQVSMTGNLAEKICLAPTYSQAFRWFREKHNIYLESSVFVWNQSKMQLAFGYKMYANPFDPCSTYKELEFLAETYEEGEEACLKKLIEIVKSK